MSSEKNHEQVIPELQKRNEELEKQNGQILAQLNHLSSFLDKFDQNPETSKSNFVILYFPLNFPCIIFYYLVSPLWFACAQLDEMDTKITYEVLRFSIQGMKMTWKVFPLWPWLVGVYSVFCLCSYFMLSSGFERLCWWYLEWLCWWKIFTPALQIWYCLSLDQCNLLC